MSVEIISIESGESVFRCVFCGPMNADRCREVHQGLVDAVREVDGVPVVFDLTEVGFASSAFMRLVLTVGKKVGRDNFHIEGANPEVRKVLKMSGLWDALALESRV